MCSRNILISQKTPGSQCVVVRTRERMLVGQSIGDSKGPNSSEGTALMHPAPMTHDRTGTIATTMKKHQDVGGIGAGNDRPFPRHPTDIDGGELHVVSY